jgi:hypothetical protein
VWPLPLIAACIPVIGSLAAWHVAAAQGFIPDCNPLWDGCASISRAGRHGLAHVIFRATIIPAAMLQGLMWWLCAGWLRSLDDRGTHSRWIAGLGIAAACFLILYASFLGVEGRTYRWLRQYGTLGYFAFTYLCLLIVSATPIGRTRIATLPRPFPTFVLVLSLALLMLGLINAVFAAFFDPVTKDRIENVTEWWAALVMSCLIGALAILWYRLGVAIRITSAT